MIGQNGHSTDERILVLVVSGRDGTLTVDFLTKSGLVAQICPDAEYLARCIEEGCAAVIVAEEALAREGAAKLSQALSRQPSWSEIPVSVITSGGETTVESLSVVSLLGPRSNVTLLERPFRPVTLVNAMQAALRSRRRQYQVRDLLDERETVLRSINDAFVTLDRQWRYTYVNEKAAALAARPAEELLGKVVWDLYPEYVGTSYHRDVLHAAETQTIKRFELLQSSSNRWLEVRVYPSSRGISILTTDITDQKRAEERLEATVAERTATLRETIGELEAFSYSISHDLRSPLRAMQAFAQVLADDYGSMLPKEGQWYLERISGASVRLDKLITDVLTYSRVLRSPLSLASVDLSALLKAIVEQYPSFQAFQENIEIREPLLPVMGHEGSLTQVITNLISNALKFVPPGRKPRVRIWTELAGKEVVIAFADNGIGIAEKDQSRIFGMFQRVHPESHYEGTGIGLAIVRKAVTRMGGSLTLHSQEGVGSEFRVRLPKG